MKKHALILFVLLTLGCDPDEDVKPDAGPEIFRLIVDESYKTHNTGDWLVIHDQSGKLIYSSRFESGDTLSAESLDPHLQKLSITFFATTASAVRTFDLRTYTDINIGEQWVLKTPASGFGLTQHQGSYKLTARDIPPNSTLRESSQFGASSSFEVEPRLPYSFKGEFWRYPESSHMVFVRDNQNNLRYKFFENVAANQEISFTYNDLLIPETTIDVSAAGYDRVFLNVDGLESKADAALYGYDVGSAFYDHQPLSIKLGYVDRLKYYRTRLTLQDDLREVVYEKAGSPPTAITFGKEPEATFDNLNAVSFSSHLNQSFQRRTSVWRYQPQSMATAVIEWVVNSPANEQKLLEFPVEIENLFPTFEPERLIHAQTKFILSGSGYDDLIATTFKGLEPVLEYEIYSANFW